MSTTKQAHIASSVTNDAQPVVALHSIAAHVTKAPHCTEHVVWRRARVISGWTVVRAGCVMNRVKHVLAVAGSTVQVAQRKCLMINTIGRFYYSVVVLTLKLV